MHPTRFILAFAELLLSPAMLLYLVARPNAIPAMRAAAPATSSRVGMALI